jgi:hypothetical protein
LRRPERARNEESTGPKRLDDTRCTKQEELRQQREKGEELEALLQTRDADIHTLRGPPSLYLSLSLCLSLSLSPYIYIYIYVHITWGLYSQTPRARAHALTLVLMPCTLHREPETVHPKAFTQKCEVEGLVTRCT